MATKPPVEVPQGAIRLNTDSQKLEFFAQDQWWEMATDVPTLDGGTRAVFMGGFRDQPVNNTSFNTIDYITIASAGNALDFGDLYDTVFDGAANISSRTRQFTYMGRAGGANPSDATNTIAFIKYSTKGNSQDFGDATDSLYYRPAGLSSATRGVRAGGSNNPGTGGVNTMDYITMAAEGNAVDFGDLATAKLRYGGGLPSPTRGIFLWGNSHPAYVNTMEYITIASTGNAHDFGDLVTGVGGGMAAGNSTRGIATSKDGDLTQSIQISTLGNAINFGTLSTTRNSVSMTSSPTRAIAAGGVISPNTYSNIIDYVSIQTQGDAVDFGDLTVNRHTDNSGSNAHGGL